MYVASRAHAMRARVRTGGGGAGRGSQFKNPQNIFFSRKSCWADAPTPYFKEQGEDSASTLSSGLHIIPKCSTSTTTSISHLTYIRTYLPT